MSRFSDDVNRVFDEILRLPWGRPTRPERRQDPQGDGVLWEVLIPVPGVAPDELAVAIGGGSVTVTVSTTRHEASESPGGAMTQQRYERRRESFALPAGYTASSLEARIEDHHLRLRVHLRPRPGVRP